MMSAQDNLETNWVHSVFNTACNILLATYSLLWCMPVHKTSSQCNYLFYWDNLWSRKLFELARDQGHSDQSLNFRRKNFKSTQNRTLDYPKQRIVCSHLRQTDWTHLAMDQSWMLKLMQNVTLMARSRPMANGLLPSAFAWSLESQCAICKWISTDVLSVFLCITFYNCLN